MATNKITKKALARSRKALKSHPFAARVAAASLLPKSRRQTGRQIGVHRREVLRIRFILLSALDPVAKAALHQEMHKHLRTIAGLLAASRKKHKRSLGFRTPGVEPVGPAQAKTRLYSAAKNLGRTSAAIKALKNQKRGGPVVKKRREMSRQLLIIQRSRLKKRIALLKRGYDFERQVRIHPSRAAIQRTKLGLPPVYTVPTPADTTMVIRLIAGALPRRRGETDRHYRLRLRAYTQRALIRVVNKRTVEKLAGPTAIRVAVEETMAQDPAALESEADAGGVAADPVAEAMDSVVDSASEQLSVATEEIQPEIPAGDISAAQIEELLAQAAEAEGSSADAPIEEVDRLEADLRYDDPTFEDGSLLLGEGDEADEDDETGMSTTHMAIGAVAVLGALWFLSGR